MESGDAQVVTPNEDERKLFVGGLPQEAKDGDIREYFGQFGEIDTVTLKTDPTTGRSRGFAFVLFKEPASLESASSSETHVIKGKKVTCKKAEAKPGKIYVGKLPEGVSKEDIQAHFAQFGNIVEVTRPVDKTNNDTPKNFAFVTFEKEEVAKQMVKLGTCNINGKDIDVKRVTAKDSGRGGFGGRGGRGGGGMGGYGGGWGGYGADPYAMYGGYGGYGADPYGAYGGYGGYDAYGGGKVRGGGRGRGRGRSRPY